MKELTRIIRLEVEITKKELEADDVCGIEETAERIKKTIYDKTDADYVNIVSAKEFIKEGRGE